MHISWKLFFIVTILHLGLTTFGLFHGIALVNEWLETGKFSQFWNAFYFTLNFPLRLFLQLIKWDVPEQVFVGLMFLNSALWGATISYFVGLRKAKA